MMGLVPALLGGALGAGLVFAFIGLKRMFNKSLSEQERKKGFWPMNIGFALACGSMYLISLHVTP